MAEEQGWLEVGARVADARKARGYSQDHLANELGVDRTAITKIEAGRRQINSLELVRLAEVLGRPLQWFVSPPPDAVISRRAAVADQRSDQKSDLAIEDIARDLAVLAGVRVLTPNTAKGSLNSIKPGDNTNWSVELAASKARSLLGVDSCQPLYDLVDLVERAGLFPYSLALGEGAADGAYVEVEGLGVALINGEIDPGRRRSTLAHELGHHLFGDAYSVDWGTDTDATECAIDSFAINLLFPRIGVTRRWRDLRNNSDLRQSAIIISAEYRVSWTAALRQLRTFELISKDEYKSLDSRSPTRADYLECNLRVIEELQPPYIPTGVSAAAIRAYRTYRLSAERVTEMLRGEIDIDDLPVRDEMPLEALRGELS
ncbi:XRE family transcriptional regulator [Sphaerisporangium sp. NPDC051017]|uniref:helix-turn-helix domain-containing protein n=1 Tax=Sphaerisporangium sp. NPDC051017 TaxID=3154636 RepID=UPI00342AA9A3